MTQAGTCSAVRRDGQPCTGPVLGEGSLCWAHDPALAARRAAKRRLGGQNRATAKRLGKLMPARLAPVFQRLERVLEETHNGTLDPKVATAMAAVARASESRLRAGNRLSGETP